MQFWPSNNKRQESPKTSLTKDKPMSIYFFKKDKRQFDNLHLILVYVLCPRITFILGRREYGNEQWVDSCVMWSGIATTAWFVQRLAAAVRSSMRFRDLIFDSRHIKNHCRPTVEFIILGCLLKEKTSLFSIHARNIRVNPSFVCVCVFFFWRMNASS